MCMAGLMWLWVLDSLGREQGHGAHHTLFPERKQVWLSSPRKTYSSQNEFTLAVSHGVSKNLCMPATLPAECPPTSTGDKNSQWGKKAASKWVKQLLLQQKCQKHEQISHHQLAVSWPVKYFVVFMWFGEKQLVLWGLSYRYKLYLESKPLVRIHFIAGRIWIWDVEDRIKSATCLQN